MAQEPMEPRTSDPAHWSARGGNWTVAAKCLVATLLVYGLAHVLEVEVLRSESSAWGEIAKASRGLAAAGVVAILVARHYGAPRTSSRTDREPRATGSGDLEAAALRRNAEWFVSLRWFAIAVVAMSVVVAVPIAGLLPDATLGPLMALTLALVGANVAFTRALAVHGHREEFLLVQFITDLTILTLLLHFSGGLENALSAVYIFHVILGGILLPRRQAFILTGIATLLYAGLGFLEMAGVVDHVTLQLHPHDEAQTIHSAHELGYVVTHVVVMTMLLFCSTYFTTLLAGRLRRSERKLVDAARLAVAEKLRLEGVVDASGAGLALRDSTGRIEWRNGRAERWLGELADSRCDGEPAPESLVARAVETRATAEREFIVERPARGPRYLLVTATPVLDDRGLPVQVVELVQDVTARRVAETGLAHNSKLAAIGELAGNVAHEINNPVGVISAKARLLLQNFGDRGLPLKVADELRKIVAYADRIASITGGLLSFARPSSGARAVVDANQAVRRALDLLEPRARAASTTIALDLADSLPSINGNLNELQQVIVNLASNAIDAMPDGGTVRIVTRAESHGVDASGDVVVVEVSDAGPGIPATMRERIFDPFYTTKPEGRGTGLGLSICHGLVRSHGGRLEVDDAQGGGAVVRVILPALPAEEVSR